MTKEEEDEFFETGWTRVALPPSEPIPEPLGPRSLGR